MDTWIKYGQYGLGFVLLIFIAYSGVQFGVDWLSESLNELKKEVNAVYMDLGKTQERFERLYEKADTLEEKSKSITVALDKVKKESSVRVGELLAELEKHPQAESLIEEVGNFSKEVKRLNSKKLTCQATPREEFQEKSVSCAADYYKLAEWCSGDCDRDDARVTLCCKYKDETIAKK